MSNRITRHETRSTLRHCRRINRLRLVKTRQQFLEANSSNSGVRLKSDQVIPLRGCTRCLKKRLTFASSWRAHLAFLPLGGYTRSRGHSEKCNIAKIKIAIRETYLHPPITPQWHSGATSKCQSLNVYGIPLLVQDVTMRCGLILPLLNFE